MGLKKGNLLRKQKNTMEMNQLLDDIKQGIIPVLYKSCPRCHADGREPCPTCKRSGFDKELGEICRTCDGARYIGKPCTVCGGDKKVPA